MKRGLFVGLVTLDLIYLVEQVPESNQKIVAKDYTVAAGGPATNASVTFNYLENLALDPHHGCATLLAAIGTHPMSQLILADLQQQNVAIADLSPASSQLPPVSSIIVTETTGERAVISLNAVKSQATIEHIPNTVLQQIDVVLLDGHQIAVGEEIAKQAKADQIPVVVDAGSWKPNLDRVLSWADYVVCSANFYPPGCHTQADVFAYLQNLGIPHIAMTHGSKPIQYLSDGNVSNIIDISVPQICAVDTVGAGDIFHGAFCHYILRSTFADALAQSANVAAQACQSFGTRQWMSVRP